MASKSQKVVEDFLAACSELDIDKAGEFIADDCVYQNMPFQKAVGKVNVIQTLKLMERFLDGFDVEMLGITSNGGTIMTERVDTLSSKFFRAEVELMGVFVVKNGKITEWRDYFDWSSMGGRFVRGLFTKAFNNAKNAVA